MRKNIKPWISVQSLLPFRSADVRERHSTARTSRQGKVETLQFSESRLDFVLGHCIHTCHKIRTWTCVFTWVLIWSDCLAVQHIPDVFYFKNHPEDSDDGLSIWPFENRTKWLRRSTLYSPFFTHDTKKRDDFNSTRYWLDFGQAKKYRVYLKEGYPMVSPKSACWSCFGFKLGILHVFGDAHPTCKPRQDKAGTYPHQRILSYGHEYWLMNLDLNHI